MTALHTILCPTEFSPHSDEAFRFACSLASDHGARIIALHVLTPPVAYGEAGAFVANEDLKPAVLADLRQLRAPDGIPIEHRIAEGSPAGEIVRVAEETNCDLIVMGTHGRTGLGRLLLGSVAEDIVRHAPCPVLTVKAGAHAAHEMMVP